MTEQEKAMFVNLSNQCIKMIAVVERIQRRDSGKSLHTSVKLADIEADAAAEFTLSEMHATLKIAKEIARKLLKESSKAIKRTPFIPGSLYKNAPGGDTPAE